MAKKRTTTRSKKVAKQESDVQSPAEESPETGTPAVQNTLKAEDADAPANTSDAQDRQSLGLDSILGAVLGGAGGGMPQQGGQGGNADPLGSILSDMLGGGQDTGAPQRRNMPQQGADDPLGAILGGMMDDRAGGMPQHIPAGNMGAQAGGIDLGSILGGVLGGGLGGGTQGGMMGGAAGALLGPLVDSISQKTGLPKAIVMAGATFLLSKLMSGGLQGSVPAGNVGGAAQGMPTQPDGGVDLGSILGGLLGGGATGGASGGAMPQQGGIDLGSILGGMMSQTPFEGGQTPGAGPSAPQMPQGGADLPGDKVLGKIGESMNSAPGQPPSPAPQGGVRIQGLVAGREQEYLQDRGLVSEFAQQAGIDESTAAQSLSAILSALEGRQP